MTERLKDRLRELTSMGEAAEGLRHLLEREWPAFNLGNITADFQYICDVKRSATHFYRIPPEPDDYAAFSRMLAAYPELRAADSLSNARAVFVAGYGTHLLYDLIWHHTVITPYFWAAEWGEPYERFMAHNTLLTYLDQECHARLPESTAAVLTAVDPTGWLPFAPDTALTRWQQMVADQLKPGVEIKTIEIYAERMRISPRKFAAQLADPAWMQANVFRHVPLALVHETMEMAVAQGMALIEAYLAPKM